MKLIHHMDYIVLNPNFNFVDVLTALVCQGCQALL